MDIGKQIKILLLKEDMTIKALAQKLGTSQQNISAKLKRSNLSVKEMEEIANVLNYKLKIEFIKKESTQK